MRIVSVVGTRPQLIKAAALSPVLRRQHDEVFVDTGQHWDDSMAGSFFAELGLPKPDVSLAAGGGSHAEQTATILRGVEELLVRDRPDAVVVYGDTNSTLGGSLAASKLGIPIAHVEAGLRSFDRRMPEEVNRVVADHLARWRFAPTPTAVANLEAEGVTTGVELVGDLMQDLAARVSGEVTDVAALDAVEAQLAAGGHRVPLRQGRFLFATIHRAENRTPAAIAAWTALLRAIATPERPVVLALHPGTRVAMAATGADPGPDVVVVEPLGYRSSLTLQLHAAAVITDSGGIQREAAWLGTPCLVLRSTTEWVEAVEGSGGRMAVIGLDAARAVAELARLAPAAGDAGAGERARRLRIEPAGAAEAIAARLSADGAAPAVVPAR
ncbi:MAG TPA: UDP-N-acetylglucosamine 2-epimerase (non-hydrolyzing) [Candidatus Limnocylindrales bacterium]